LNPTSSFAFTNPPPELEALLGCLRQPSSSVSVPGWRAGDVNPDGQNLENVLNAAAAQGLHPAYLSDYLTPG
jgi:hypothetical protein